MEERRDSTGRRALIRSAAAAGACLVLGWFAFVRGTNVPLLSGVDLGFHELGHLLTRWLPFVIMLMAGSITQVLVPVGDDVGDRYAFRHALLAEAENERMHLMTFIHIAKPTTLERWLVLFAQGLFYNAFFLLYLISSRTAHRVAGYFEEEAIISYTEYLAEIESGRTENIAAPQIAIDYWKLLPDARLTIIDASRANLDRARRLVAESGTKGDSGMSY
jgi:hypothetical protein